MVACGLFCLVVLRFVCYFDGLFGLFACFVLLMLAIMYCIDFDFEFCAGCFGFWFNV